MMNLTRRCGWWEISALDFSSGKAIISLLEIGRCMERCFANSGTSEGRSTEIGAEQAGHVGGGGGTFILLDFSIFSDIDCCSNFKM